ncbi:hypothetical protein [Exiguobacterium sp. 17-1]|uniref:hypothetical protein n=1 Tax=Exiguobacterium sp. 17-1 TaxID=2931981 RepID=UPI001FFE95B6|nr:hypothetical protein [Exiguobacterium sp. 17-1]MCK2157547.1 hypothetical protein [Exiguobacterium sp. 17-1]
MVLSFIGSGVVLVLFALGLKCVRSKHPDETPFLDAANGTDSIIGSVLMFILCSLSVKQYGYLCVVGGFLLLYGISTSW